TGSKGKGSVSNMISRILQSEKRVGLMTSPHLTDFCERFRVNGVKISDEDFIYHMGCIRPYFDSVEAALPKNVCISPMGIQTALGLSYFNDEKTDFNVFEGGKGARFDDVNNVEHPYAVINSIFLEHTRELGNTLEKIAEDKSYVINGRQKCVYAARQKEEVMKVIRKRAEKYQVPLKVYGDDFRAVNIRYTQQGMLFDVSIGEEEYRDLRVPLLGEYQAENCALAMALCRDILGPPDLDKVRGMLAGLCWPGRMEVISREPFMVLDACINRASCKYIRQSLSHMKPGKYTLILGIPDDKDYQGVAEAMEGYISEIILTKSRNPHYVFTGKQKEELEKTGMKITASGSVEEAVKKAKEGGGPILILGTTAVVSEVKKMHPL
ncbi:MAG: bifunctional protein FolC, partial [Lachnospiraceae bacterium]|nr:bifunctional protein FolC [Lachnospiraceae bacterium]